MPAAPATHPRPKIGVRFTSLRNGMRLMSRASMVGLAMPVTEAKKIAETSAAVRPRGESARSMQVRPSSTALVIHTSLVARKPTSPG